VKNILIVQTAFIGDVILATGLLESLHRRYPTAKIDLLLRKGNEKLFDEHPFISRLWIWDKKKEKYRNLFGILKDIRKEKYDLLVNVQRFGASGMVSVLSGAAMIVGFAKNPFSRFFDYRSEHILGAKGSKDFLHETQRNFQLIAHLDGTEMSKPRLYPSDAHRDRAAIITGTDPYITISPASVWFTKQWPESKWIELAGAFKKFRIFLLGSPSDKEICNRLQMAIGENSISLAGVTEFLTSAAIMQGAAMNFTNDSAPLHLAGAVNAPVCAVFCSTIPEFGFGPLSDTSIVVQTKSDLPCRPCGIHGKKACPKQHFRCAYDIDVGEIIRQLKIF
jgi:heptosyltransferase-2